MMEFLNILWQIILFFGKLFLGVFQIYRLLSYVNTEILAGIIGVPTFVITVFSFARSIVGFLKR